jgi:predicted nucleotidyltransferase
VEKAQSAPERNKVLQIIRLHKEKFSEQYGVTKIGIFGSVAKGLTRPGSDVDVVVEMSRPDLFYLVHIKNELEEALGSDVDVLHYRKNMNRLLQKRIEQEAVYV